MAPESSAARASAGLRKMGLRRQGRGRARPLREISTSAGRLQIPRHLPLAAGNRGAREREELAAVVDGILQGIEAADEEGGDAEIVVVEERVGDLCRRAHQ